MTIDILYIEDVMKYFNFSRQTISNYVKANKFPKPFKRAGKLAWTHEEIHKWERDNINDRT